MTPEELVIDMNREISDPGTTVLAMTDSLRSSTGGVSMSRGLNDDPTALDRPGVLIVLTSPEGNEVRSGMTPRRAVEFAAAVLLAVEATGVSNKQAKAWATQYARAVFANANEDNP